MQRLKQAIQSESKFLIPYLTPDFPFRGVTEEIVRQFEMLRVKIIELGIPCSDPLADGVMIQQASTIALKNGVTVKRVLELAKEINTTTSISVILMGYLNQMIQYGFEKFLADAEDAGVQGLIIPDLPQEEAVPYKKMIEEHNISIIYLVAPTSKPERVKAISEQSTLFSYCVSMNGVTGSSGFTKETIENLTTSVNPYHKKPFVVGFGISKEEDVRLVTSFAKGAVVGSALLKEVMGCTDKSEAVKKAVNFLKPLSEAVNG